MKAYSKPIAIVADEAEGVYLSSGANASTEKASYTIKQTNAWDGNRQYDMTFTNNTNEKVDAVTVKVKVKGEVTSIGGNVTGTVSGNTATITFNNYGNGIEANTTTGAIYVAVTGNGDFGLE